MVDSSYWKKAITYGALTVALAIGTPQAKAQTLESKIQTEYAQKQDSASVSKIALGVGRQRQSTLDEDNALGRMKWDLKLMEPATVLT